MFLLLIRYLLQLATLILMYDYGLGQKGGGGNEKSSGFVYGLSQAHANTFIKLVQHQRRTFCRMRQQNYIASPESPVVEALDCRVLCLSVGARSTEKKSRMSSVYGMNSVFDPHFQA